MSDCTHCKVEVEVAEIRAIVGRIESELTGHGLSGGCASHAKRLSALETWRSWITGALAALGLAMATATAVGAAMLGRAKP